MADLKEEFENVLQQLKERAFDIINDMEDSKVISSVEGDQLYDMIHARLDNKPVDFDDEGLCAETNTGWQSSTWCGDIL